MCLAVPGKICDLQDGFAQVDFGGILRRISVALAPAVNVGDWVLVHAGFVIQVLGEAEAQEQLALVRDVLQASLPQEITDDSAKVGAPDGRSE